MITDRSNAKNCWAIAAINIAANNTFCHQFICRLNIFAINNKMDMIVKGVSNRIAKDENPTAINDMFEFVLNIIKDTRRVKRVDVNAINLRFFSSRF